MEKITPDWSAEDVSKLAERLEGSDRLDDVGRKMAVNALRSLQSKLNSAHNELHDALHNSALVNKIAELQSRLNSIREPLDQLCAQRWSDEMSAAERLDADFMGGYDQMVLAARELRTRLFSTLVERPAYVETQCSIREYDGAYKCFTHNRMWGAVTNPQTPCVGWTSGRGEHAHDFRPSELIPDEHVCSCGKYYAVETHFPPDHQPLDTQGDCPCAVCRPSRDVEIPEHFVTCPHCKTRFSGVGDYMSDFNRHIQECSGKKVERRGSIHPADCVLSCKGCGAAPGEAHAVGCEFE